MIKGYWIWYDTRDFITEAVGRLPSHSVRLFLYRFVLGITIGEGSRIHRGCRFYCPSGIFVGQHSIINRDVLLDGRARLEIGNNVSISESTMIFTLEHDLAAPSFENRAGPVSIGDRVFMGARAIVLPGVTIKEGAAVAAGADVTRDVERYTVVAGVPARPIAQRPEGLSYVLNYCKFLG